MLIRALRWVLKWFPFLRNSRLLNRVIINYIATLISPRPRPYSLFSTDYVPIDHFDNDISPGTPDYASWESVTNRKYSARILESADDLFMNNLPPFSDVIDFMILGEEEQVMSDRNSVFFMSFAQWFIDGFFRTDLKDIRKNTSNHHVDLCQIYGLTNDTTKLLRTFKNGQLKTQTINNQEYPPYLFDDKGNEKDEFRALPYLHSLKYIYRDFFDIPERKNKFYVTGLDIGNLTVGHSLLNMLFIRAHNKISASLGMKYNWDDERSFQTTRNILIVILIKLVMEEYISHISSLDFNFQLDPSFAESKSWYRENWIPIEFNLLYRWHGLVPSYVTLGGQQLSTKDGFNLNNEVAEKNKSLGLLFEEMSQQRAGKIVAGNIQNFLNKAESIALYIARSTKLKSYNDYREAFGSERLKRMDQLTTDAKKLDLLNKLYKSNVDYVELTVGLFLEESKHMLGGLMTDMVGYDAFTHLLTNPLLSKNIYGPDTFSAYGMQLIEKINSISDLVQFVEDKRFNVSLQYQSGNDHA